MKKIWKIVLVITLIISIFFNVLSYSFIRLNNTEWENAYDKLGAECEMIDIQWCELSEEYTDAVNNMLIELRYYDPYYNEIELLTSFDCWE